MASKRLRHFQFPRRSGRIQEAIVFALDHRFSAFIPLVGPWQFHGIEINPYAYELAQMTLWIGYLQWVRANGWGTRDDPILRPMDTFACHDAILDLTHAEGPKEPAWPKVDFIVGNPPFLGDKLMREELGDAYVHDLRTLYAARLPGQADLCCYWFEKARAAIASGTALRAGLLATQGIRGGANREVLKRIKKTGDIFFAVSDRQWILEGANVHVSMVAFDDGSSSRRMLDGRSVVAINANLTTETDLTKAVALPENRDTAFIGVSMHGPFDLDEPTAVQLLMYSGNPHARPNSEVVRPILNADEITRRRPRRWILAFSPGLDEEHCALYEKPFEHVRQVVKPVRDRNHRKSYRDRWWLHGEARPAMLQALAGLPRFLATPRVSKHRVFVWVDSPVVASDATVAFAHSDDYVFGVLHSRLHQLWALAQGTQLREKESGFRYTPTTCFETFPFPEPRSSQRQAITAAARDLDNLRSQWLTPSEWVIEQMLEFPGSIQGPWRHYVQAPDARGIGTVLYSRFVPRDAECAAQLQERTLTNLYNQRPAWLLTAHSKLDLAVFAAYGWQADLTDEKLLERLLGLNLARSRA